MSKNDPEVRPIYHQKEDASSSPLRCHVNEKSYGCNGKKLETSAAIIVTSQERLAKIAGTFAMIAILLSCLGLFALITYLSIRRTKEISIRKINGAKVFEVMHMLGREYIKLGAIAFFIACSISWYVMHKWLLSFAYKTELSWWVFAFSGITALGITLLTVSGQSWRAA